MSLVVSTEPTSLVAVDDQCARVEAWAATVESIPDLRDASNKLAAIGEYLTLTSSEGCARVAASQRRLEVRIGSLLGPAPTPQESGARKGSLTNEPSPLTANQRSDFRNMADDADTVEEVIAASTDDAPASRRKVTEAIKGKAPAKPRRSSLPDAAERAGWDFRKALERIERIEADDRFAANREQVAAQLRGHLTYATEVLADLLAQLDTDPTEDR